jgi:gliding motility-associated lipoprotein GldH
MINAQLKISNLAVRQVSPVLLTLYLFSACQTVDLYEKNVPVPGHHWASSFKPEFSFTIKDSIVLYQPYFIIRHTEKYNYNNIWINFYYLLPGDTMRKEMREMQLATNEKGWLASGLDDIYEHRLPLTDKPFKLKAGDYKFQLENIMREDPLKEVLSVGIRLEKIH